MDDDDARPVQQPQYVGLATAPQIMIVMVLRLVLAPQPPLVLYKCSAGTSNLLVLLLGLLFGHTMYDDALKSMAFTAQISYSHEKQFRVIPIIIIAVLVVAYSRKVYREFISFCSPWVGAGRGHRRTDRHQTPEQ